MPRRPDRDSLQAKALNLMANEGVLHLKAAMGQWHLYRYNGERKGATKLHIMVSPKGVPAMAITRNADGTLTVGPAEGALEMAQVLHRNHWADLIMSLLEDRCREEILTWLAGKGDQLEGQPMTAISIMNWNTPLFTLPSANAMIKQAVREIAGHAIHEGEVRTRHQQNVKNLKAILVNTIMDERLTELGLMLERGDFISSYNYAARNRQALEEMLEHQPYVWTAYHQRMPGDSLDSWPELNVSEATQKVQADIGLDGEPWEIFAKYGIMDPAADSDATADGVRILTKAAYANIAHAVRGLHPPATALRMLSMSQHETFDNAQWGNGDAREEWRKLLKETLQEAQENPDSWKMDPTNGRKPGWVDFVEKKTRLNECVRKNQAFKPLQEPAPMA